LLCRLAVRLDWRLDRPRFVLFDAVAVLIQPALALDKTTRDLGLSAGGRGLEKGGELLGVFELVGNHLGPLLGL
jgi:hypothetical protein